MTDAEKINALTIIVASLLNTLYLTSPTYKNSPLITRLLDLIDKIE